MEGSESTKSSDIWVGQIVGSGDFTINNFNILVIAHP